MKSRFNYWSIYSGLDTQEDFSLLNQSCPYYAQHLEKLNPDVVHMLKAKCESICAEQFDPQLCL